ncbi:hypothetical protein AXX17_AT5G02860 [Arabidopsis thaliana]|uniref:DnaJ homologue subfamily C member 28 conserved domain-containing protein n=1 Tax=Arabidopsis thaliana TaxID=3702 RepID=A0A178UDG8_ARATH|nr:hypothetical protein AXX17_AT5G02860 [Arabidopsis thaliana]
MAVRLARSLAASPSSRPSCLSLGNRFSASDITSSAINGGEFSDFVRAFAFYSSSSSWWSSPDDLTASSKRKEKKTTERFSAVIDAVHDRKLPPELRGRRDFVSSETKRVNTKVNFSLSDDDSDEETETPVTEDSKKQEPPPPPYDPFSKKPAIEEPEDPKNLQEIFHKMRTEGFTNEAVKMFDALSKDGRTHEALELFSQIKDKNRMPDVVAHTAIVEAYANAGQAKETLKVFMRMLASGVSPNAYTYSVLIKGLAADGKTHKDAKKYLLEMMGNGMSPNAATYTAVFEAFVREGKEESARELLQEMKGKGFVPDEKANSWPLCDASESETDIINVVEQRIWHSMEEGHFENLPGKGKPLNLHTNPHADPAEDTLYRILNKNGFAPEWVELNKEIRNKAKEWRVSLKKAWTMKLEEDQSGWEERSDLLKNELKKINNMVFRYNLIVPFGRQMFGLKWEKEIDRLKE